MREYTTLPTHGRIRRLHKTLQIDSFCEVAGTEELHTTHRRRKPPSVYHLVKTCSELSSNLLQLLNMIMMLYCIFCQTLAHDDSKQPPIISNTLLCRARQSLLRFFLSDNTFCRNSLSESEVACFWALCKESTQTELMYKEK